MSISLVMDFWSALRGFFTGMISAIVFVGGLTPTCQLACLLKKELN